MNAQFSSVQKQMLDLLEGWLRHKSDTVNFEAARAICEMKNVNSQQLTKAIAGGWLEDLPNKLLLISNAA
jgi:hypothetical protein